MAEMLGYDEKDIENTHYNNYIFPEDVEDAAIKRNELLTGKTGFLLNERHFRRRNSRIDNIAVRSYLLTAKNQIVYFIRVIFLTAEKSPDINL